MIESRGSRSVQNFKFLYFDEFNLPNKKGMRKIPEISLQQLTILIRELLVNINILVSYCSEAGTGAW